MGEIFADLRHAIAERRLIDGASPWAFVFAIAIALALALTSTVALAAATAGRPPSTLLRGLDTEPGADGEFEACVDADADASLLMPSACLTPAPSMD
jgi:hypothetical protein